MKSERLIVISARDVDTGSGTNAAVFQEFKQMTITFVDAADLVVLARFSMRQ